MMGASGVLSIIATYDPFPGVMDGFLRAVVDFSAEAPCDVEVIIVNGFSNVSFSGDACDADERLRVRWISSVPGEGQSHAILHGITLSRGHVVISIDPDMYRNVPDIQVMLDCYKNGCQVVFTRRVARRDVGLFRICASHLFSAILGVITGVRIRDFNSPMFLVSREVVNELVPLGLPVEAYKFCLYFMYKDRFSQVDITDKAGHVKKRSHYGYLTLLVLFVRRIRESLRYRRFP